ncbi:MAG: hypothetical protein AAF492_05415 [Verrucomicrobiota bacterium]
MKTLFRTFSTNTWTALIGGLLLLVTSMAHGEPAQIQLNTRNAGTVAKVDGDVYYLNDKGDPVYIKKGDIVPFGRVILTGEDGKVSIETAEGQTRSFGPMYAIKLKKLRDISLSRFLGTSSESTQNKGLGNNPGNLREDAESVTEEEEPTVTRSRRSRRANEANVEGRVISPVN